MNTIKAVCFGEVLWDVFPEGKKIGGAPLNVTLHLSNLDIDCLMISKIGEDANGREILDYLVAKKLSPKGIQTDTAFPTGMVKVHLEKGIASYEIVSPAAWDKIAMTVTAKTAVAAADFFVFGSLAARDITSQKALLELLEVASYKVFDVNLRIPHYSYELLEMLLKKADFVKFNDEEILEISKALGCKEVTLESQMQWMASKIQATTICVTRGGDGAILYHNGEWFSHSGFKVQVVDTVGAGDAFLATLLANLHLGIPPQKAIAKACAMGALVASKAGANPVIAKAERALIERNSK